MKLWVRRGIRYTFEIERELRPVEGDRYRDLRGHIWTVECVICGAILTPRGLPPTHQMWTVTFRGDHYATSLAIEEPLEAVQESRTTPPITGHLQSEQSCTGFGEVRVGDTTYSWVFRLVETDTTSWLLWVGPRVPLQFGLVSPVNPKIPPKVPSPNEVLFERRGVYAPTPYELPWDLVTNALQEFVRERSVP